MKELHTPVFGFVQAPCSHENCQRHATLASGKKKTKFDLGFQFGLFGTREEEKKRFFGCNSTRLVKLKIESVKRGSQNEIN